MFGTGVRNPVSWSRVTDTTFIRRHEDLHAQAGARPKRISPWAVWLYGLPAAALLGGVLHVNGLGPFQPLAETLQRESQLEEKIIQLKGENGTLKEEVDQLKPGHFGIEKRAREQLGWSKPGEIVIHIPDKR